jgi:hypothetical protein
MLSGYLGRFQVVEITGSAVLKAELYSTTSWTLPASQGNDPALDTDVNIATTGAVVLWAANFEMANNGTTDTNAYFQLGTDDSGVGAIVSEFSDTTNVVGGKLLARAVTGISGSHSFQLRGTLQQSTPSIDTSRTRTLFIISFGTLTYSLSGVTRDAAGDALGSCDVYLVKNNGDDTMEYVAYQLSNASTGAFSFAGLGVAYSSALQVIAFKDGTPNLMDCTEWTLTGTEE